MTIELPRYRRSPGDEGHRASTVEDAAEDPAHDCAIHNGGVDGFFQLEGAEVPRHMRRPGDEGYRTPTIEDAAEDAAHDFAIHNGNFADGLFQLGGTKLRQAHTSALEALDNPAFRGPERRDTDESVDRGGACSRRTCSDSTVVRLSWKKRLRHFTWAYFTLTMATGGIANVLYSSGCRRQVWCQAN